jgi:dGTPase
VVTRLERRYATFDGLNLAWDTLEGLVKHNGPLTDRGGRPLGRYAERGVPLAILEYCKLQDLDLWSHASAEAQAAAIADDIAYDAHDIDDGLRAGLFRLDDLKEMPLTAHMIADIDRRYPQLDDDRRGAELVRELISYLIAAVFDETQRRLEAARPASVEAVRKHGAQLAAFPDHVAAEEAAIKAFLKTRMYRHDWVMRIMRDAEAIVSNLFQRYQRDPTKLPAEWLPHGPGGGASGAVDARLIGNFIAGMTDRFALTEHQRLFDSTPDLR